MKLFRTVLLGYSNYVKYFPSTKAGFYDFLENFKHAGEK